MKNDKIVRRKIKEIATKYALKEIHTVSHPVQLVEITKDAIALNCLPKNALYSQEVELPCKFRFDEEMGEIFRTDYVLVPRDNIKKVGETFGIITDYKVKTMADLKRDLSIKAWRRHSSFERVLLSWGTEVFQLAGVDLLTCQDEKCRRCERGCLTTHYIISPLLAGMIKASNIAIVEIEYPCRITNIDSILRGYNTDPPKVRVVFPELNIE